MDLNLRANLGLVCTALLVCAGVLAAGPARADQLVPTDQSASEASGPPGGKYGGVTPEGKANNPLPQAPASPPSLIWTGFQPTATGSRVFFQTTGLVEFEVKEGHVSKGGHSALTVVLRGCRINLANNRRKLDTRAFPRPCKAFRPSSAPRTWTFSSRFANPRVPRQPPSRGPTVRDSSCSTFRRASRLPSRRMRQPEWRRPHAGPHRVTAGRFPATVTQ